MKKLYFLDEEEKNRILNIHEDATKRQYLKEDAIADFEAKLPKETKDKFFKMKLAWEGPGTNEQGIVDALNTFSGKDYNLYNQYLALKKPEGVTSIEGIINAEMGYDNTEDVDKVVAALKRFGLTGTYQKIDKDKYNNKLAKPYYKEKTFKITKGGVPVVQPPVKDTKQPVVDPKVAYQQRGKQTLSPRILNVQKQLGIQNATGKIDVATLQSLLTKLNSGTQAQSVSSLTPSGSQPQAGMTADQLNDTIKQLQANPNKPV